MASPRVLVLRAPGTNCDEETAFAFEKAGGIAERIHLHRLLQRPNMLADYQVLCVPGGFSYGDDIAAGRIFANHLRQHLAEALQEVYQRGALILGICNGLQVLLQAGLLAPPDDAGPRATLTWNDSGKFEDRWVRLAVTGRSSAFLRGIERLELPVAHAEGKFVTRDEAALAAMQEAGLLVLRYDSASGDIAESDGLSAPVPYPHNPNGSLANVAGICDSSGRVFGLMPHPERFVDPTQHPRWTRQPRLQAGDGLAIFRNAIHYFR